MSAIEKTDIFGTCFPAGSKVLMHDMSWKSIEKVEVGELMFSVEGPTECVYEHVTFLGDRKMITFSDKSLYWSEEHSFWTKQNGSEWWWSYNADRLRYEVEIGLIGGLKDNFSLRTGEIELEYAHIDGWKLHKSLVATDKIFNEKTPLFLPLTNGKPIVVNGYLVGAQLNEYAFDYKSIKWDTVIASVE